MRVFVIMGGVIVASTLFAYSFGNRILQLHQREQLRREAITALDQVVSTVADAETGQRGFIITGDERYLAPFKEAEIRIQERVDELRKGERMGISPVDLETLNQLVDSKFAELKKTIDLRRAGESEQAISMVGSGEGKEAMDRIRSLTGRVRSGQEAMLRAEAYAGDEATRTRTLVFISTALLNLACLAWGYRRIQKSLRDREAAIDSAQRQSDLLSTTLASIGDCVIVTDPRGRITFMNSVAEEVTGWSLAEAKNRPLPEVFRIINEETRDVVENPVDKVLKEGVIVALANHTLLIRKDGSEVPIDDSGAPIRNPKGGLEGVVLVFRDFSKHRQAERDLREAKESAEGANQAKDNFLAMVSHELRTPLSPVLATLHLWEANSALSPEIKTDVQMLRRNIELEARIIDDLLDLTRISRGMLSVSPELTDVHGLIKTLLDVSRSDFTGKNLQLVSRLQARQHCVRADGSRLQQVLGNILRNAIKFTDPGGTITVTTSNDKEDQITVAISDTGIGMSPELLSKLFTPFEQGDRERSQRSGGLGLGMTISRALVDLMEGTLVAESDGPGRGSTFKIAFPATEGAADATPPPSRSPQANARGNILLVEDHADSAASLARLLRTRGYEVVTAESVAAAVQLFQEDNIDLLVCDVGLPDGTGYDLIQHIRTNSKIPAIALTGFGMFTDIEKSKDAGFDAHLTKPVNCQRLEVAISNLMTRNGGK